MGKIVLYADSLADLSPELANRFDVKIIPLGITFKGDETTYLDGVDISEEEAIRMSCLTKKELEAYEFSAEQKDFCLYMIGLYCWHISDLKIYDKPKRITQFKGRCRLENSCLGCPDWNYQMADCNGRTITRPPQSWCYVEG